MFHDVTVLGVQEALHEQVVDLQQRLTSFKYVGKGRDDGKQKGEYAAIFYDTTRLQLLETQTFWLSEQPTVPGSKGWDAAITRIVTWAKFKDRKTKKQFYAFNTHFDHMGKTARKESAALLLSKVKEIAGSYPSVVTGDFNAQPSDEPIQVITDSANPDHLTDSKSISITPHYGPAGTFNGFKQKEATDQPIDYIFVKNGGRVLKHATLSQSWEGRFSSDHFPVLAVIVL
ncbi:MAG TPA: endonuclease/exonuclease/phosphatase family protein [Flavisolibacter sp.]|nr:endonuclease/exonuclease/phosphatase family protein [Flavisolibacter sp.]